MRRASRLFDIVQILRRDQMVRAGDIASELEVSKRTIYRDIAALTASGVPIEGEAGVGYILRDGADIPPLMFVEEEIEAIVTGIRIVESWADWGLANGARSALRKIEAAIPSKLRDHMLTVPIDAPSNHHAEPITVCRYRLRHAIRDRKKVRIDYASKQGIDSSRIIRPLLLSFFGPIWNLSAWCELRSDFRTFRIDFIREATILEETFEHEDGKRLDDLMALAPDER